MACSVKRLKKRSDFVRISREGVSSRAFAVSALLAASGDASQGLRVGFTVSKRHVSPKAVVRNRVKRRLRAWADNFLLQTVLNQKANQNNANQHTELNIEEHASGDFVFMARRALADMPFSELCRQCEDVVKQCIAKQKRM